MRFAIKLLASQVQGALACAEKVPTPCQSVCRMDDHGHCEGCLRTLDEIGQWALLDDEGKRVIWRRIATRLQERGIA